MRCLAIVALAWACGACSLGKHSIRTDPPPLVDAGEPRDLRDEPKDEVLRAMLPAGSFTGIHVADARQSLEELAGAEEGAGAHEPAGVLVAAVVENSPADLAGVMEGDLILEARAARSTGVLRWPSDWRKLEIDTPPGTELSLVLDRAGTQVRAALTTAPRARPAPREAGARFREDAKVGVVLRTATEVEARAADLGPGGGAVIVGLARASPWRGAGLVFGDLVTKVDGESVAHPEVLLAAIRRCGESRTLKLEVVRAGKTRTVEAPVSRRAGEVREVDVPLLFSYTRERGITTWSVLLGLVKRESTRAAWRWRLLWFIEFSGGDADHLEEEKP